MRTGSRIAFTWSAPSEKTTNTLSLNVENSGLWCCSGQEVAEVRGCLDVDLSITPATNTLPIRRLDLGIGESESVTAAWIKFPELEVEPLSQRYTRTAENIYRYESDTGFSAEIKFDDLGLVVTYPGGWERIAALKRSDRWWEELFERERDSELLGTASGRFCSAKFS